LRNMSTHTMPTTCRTREKVAVIGTNGLPARYGGFETLTHHLTLSLRDQFDFIVYCSATPKANRLSTYNDARLVYLPFRANGYQSVVYDTLSIIHAWFSADKLLILGSSGALILPLRSFARKKIVLNIGGIDWGRSKWSYQTKKFLQICERLCVRFADVVITDNRYIQRLYKDRYGVDSILIEYGGDHVTYGDVPDVARQRYAFLSKDYTLCVSRAQSDNNIHMVLEAFEQMPDRTLVVISNWASSKYGRELKGRYLNRLRNIHVLDAIYEQNELDMIRKSAALYIHSHSFCGTAPSLVEAMNLGLPVVCYDTPTNVETTENKSIYFSSHGELIVAVQSLSKERALQLGADMKEIASRRYRWNLISEKYARCLHHQ